MDKGELSTTFKTRGELVELSRAGGQEIGHQALVLPCPVASALTVHHFVDCIAVDIPIDSTVRAAAMLDLQGSRAIVERMIDAVHRLLRKDSTKLARVHNEHDLNTRRFATAYAKEIAARLIRSTFDFFHRYNTQSGRLDEYRAKAADIRAQAANGQNQAPAVAHVEPEPRPGSGPGSCSWAQWSIPAGSDKPRGTSGPAKVKNEPKTKCHNCGNTDHEKASCKAGCRTCGRSHNLSATCPKEGRKWYWFAPPLDLAGLT